DSVVFVVIVLVVPVVVVFVLLLIAAHLHLVAASARPIVGREGLRAQDSWRMPPAPPPCRVRATHCEQCLTGRGGGGGRDGGCGGDVRQVNYYLVKEEQSLHLVGVLQVCKKSFVSFP